MDELENKIFSFVIENYHLDPNKFTPESSLVSSGIIDSMGIMEIVDFLEKELGIVIDDQDIVEGNFESVNSILNFVKSKQ